MNIYNKDCTCFNFNSEKTTSRVGKIKYVIIIMKFIILMMSEIHHYYVISIILEQFKQALFENTLKQYDSNHISELNNNKVKLKMTYIT